MTAFFPPLLREHLRTHPLILVDIGARWGLQSNWSPVRENLRLIVLEADPAEHARLAQAHRGDNVLFINAAAYSRATQLPLNIGRAGGTSSIFEPNHAFLARFPDPGRYDVVERVEVRADSIDHLLRAHGVKDVDFIKIDTQGAETPILDGAAQMLRECVIGVEVEVIFAPLYVGQSEFGEIDARLRQAGFQLFDLRPSYWKRTAGARYGGPKGQLVFADALYLVTEDAFQRRLDAIEDSVARSSKLLRALAVCLLYGYADFAIELLEPNRGLLDREAAEKVASQLRSEIPLSARLPHFRGRGWLSHFFYRLHRALFPTVGGWASGGRNIGNLD